MRHALGLTEEPFIHIFTICDEPGGGFVREPNRRSSEIVAIATDDRSARRRYRRLLFTKPRRHTSLSLYHVMEPHHQLKWINWGPPKGDQNDNSERQSCRCGADSE